ncbi:PTS system, lactose/cellobiose-specific IIA component [Leptotrichia trevisanii]|jgi:lichenan-specific phosphotransferase enzyme IIA component|uniref:PTS system, lactose/cellobiose-specific IIA component n=1 Tax=Leptotrichia trevisanii TaxID=109328 RepID=A0A510KSC2_9FUSO|nr:PTS lactose/cellobiose transporter subunit IIA [Leptotrichia trevisanii]BBM52933.1 PTS system, lactose/cellobiose-specific IIA component [Leptotrichia trevisanii]
MNDEKYEIAFQVIMNAGNSKSSSMMAIEAAREFDFEEAERLLVEADKEMREAHHVQTELIQRESNGDGVDVNIILVHSQDHLSMAITARDNAEEFLQLYKMIKELKDKIEKN